MWHSKILYSTRLRSVVILSLLTCVISTSALGKGLNGESFTRDERSFLIALFEEEDFDRDLLNRVFLDARLKKMSIVVRRNVYNSEKRERYQNFLSPYSINLANKFSRKWRSTLAAASQQFGVDREVLVALLLVETGLGSYLGKYSVISVFSSILVTKQIYDTQCQNQIVEECQDQFIAQRLEKKSRWAKKELMALLTISSESGKDPFELRGSFAGAFGIPQFLPSSYLKWGYDADQSGSVNLFLFPDAIYSAANYLKAHGWRMGLDQEDNRKALFAYNNSHIYVDTVMEVALKVRASSLKTKSGKNTVSVITASYSKSRT